MLRQIARDALTVARTLGGGRVTPRSARVVLAHDGVAVLALSRLRSAARRWHIPLAEPLLRRAQTVLYGVEISRDAYLGEGVCFAHTVGIVIGGDSHLGDRVMLLGNNTIGTVKHDGFPRIGCDVVVGAGARILGPVTIGDGATIGANAVVVHDVPPGATAVGIPAVVRVDRRGARSAGAREADDRPQAQGHAAAATSVEGGHREAG